MDGYDAIVCDFGSQMAKTGFCGENCPRSCFPTIIGRPNGKRTPAASYYAKTYYFGDEAYSKKDFCTLSYAIDRGLIVDWDAFRQLVHQMWSNELRIDPEAHPFMFAQPPFTPEAQKKKLMEEFFEHINAPAFAIENSDVLAMYASGRTTGIILNVGEGISHSTPILSGYSLPRANQKFNIGGKDVTNYLVDLLHSRGASFTTTAEFETVRDIKHNLSYVPLDFDEEMWTSSCSSELEKSYLLWDGQVITLGNERFRCAEGLFLPYLFGYEMPGVHEMTHESIMKCDIDLRRDLYSNIILCGGSTKIPGFQDRLQKEITNLVPAEMRIRVIAPPERKYSVWIGGSIIASINQYNNYVALAEWNEVGPNASSKFNV